MKFKVDENLPAAVAEFLCDHGHNAHTVQQESMTGVDDESIFAVCQREQRIILPLDLDFADLRRYPPAHSAGIIVLRLERHGRDYIVAFMPRLMSLLDSETITGSLRIVDEVRTRIRRERS